jgi:hypothetical protein
MIDIINQLLLHILGAILLHRLVDGIPKPLPRANRVDRAIAAFQVYAFVFVEGIGVTVAVGVVVTFRVAAEEVASSPDHSCVVRNVVSFQRGLLDKTGNEKVR